MSKPILLISSDWHISDNKPACRMEENWLDYQFSVIRRVSALAIKCNVPHICAGDLFDKPYSASHDLVNNVYASLDGSPLYFIPGNHDLVGHSTHDYDKTSLCSLGNMKNVFNIANQVIHIGTLSVRGVEYDDLSDYNEDIIVLHQFVWDNPVPGAKDSGNIYNVARRYKNAKLIICGDNHERFISYVGNTCILNCGALIRRSAALISYVPAVYVLNDDMTIQVVRMNTSKDLITDKHLAKADTSQEYSGFIKNIGDCSDVSVSFIDNLNKLILESPVKGYIEGLLKEI